MRDNIVDIIIEAAKKLNQKKIDNFFELYLYLNPNQKHVNYIDISISTFDSFRLERCKRGEYYLASYRAANMWDDGYNNTDIGYNNPDMVCNFKCFIEDYYKHVNENNYNTAKELITNITHRYNMMVQQKKEYLNVYKNIDLLDKSYVSIRKQLILEKFAK